MIEKLPHLEDDGLITPEVGSWAEYKYRLVNNYATMFATSIKTKWQARIYIDLFAGAGRSRIENSSLIVPASPLLALDIPDKFDKYIFCEDDEQKLQALKERVKRDYSHNDVSFIAGDVNGKVDLVLNEIPQHRTDYKVITFCFCDPYKMKSLKFQTILKLSQKFVDFLILIPSYMDAHRNVSSYIEENNKVVEEFTGVKGWRDEWHSAKLNGMDFGLFIADLFGNEMKKLKYSYAGLIDMDLIRSTEKNLPLYHLACFSRNPLGEKLCKEARKYSTDQIKMPF